MRFATKCKPGQPVPKTGKKVAIIGAGPAGLGAAGELICMGHEVHVYDQMPEPGGLMIFGIPDYHVPTAGVRKGVQELRELGVKFFTNTRVYDTEPSDEYVTFEGLIREYDAVLIATGTWDSRRLNVPGEDLGRVYPALEWLIDFYMAQHGYKPEEEVPPLGRVGLVIGGGLTAVDAVEVPLRYAKDKYGIEKVYLSYRRSRKEAPMGEREFNRLVEKLGVEPLELTIPLEFKGDEKGNVRKAVLQRTRLEPVPGKRPRPIPIPGTEFEIEVDYVMVAIGEIPTPPFKDECCGIKLNRNGTIMTDEKFRTTRKGVFAAGDVKHGPSLIGPALKSGKDAAKYINEYLQTGEWS